MTPDLSSIAVTLDTARALQAAGFPQDTSVIVYGPGSSGRSLRSETDREPGECAAPTLAELREQLPDSISYRGTVYDLVSVKGGGLERIGYLSPDDVVLQFRAGPAATARAWAESEVAAEAAAELCLLFAKAGYAGPSS